MKKFQVSYTEYQKGTFNKITKTVIIEATDRKAAKSQISLQGYCHFTQITNIVQL